MYFTKTGIRKINKQILPHIEIDQTTSSPGNAVLSTPNIESSVSSLPSTSSTSILILQSIDSQLNFEKTGGENENTQPLTNKASNRRTPSPTSSGLTSIFDSPKTFFYKNLSKFVKKL